MKKFLILSYSFICYLIGLFVVAYYADFFVGEFIPKSINEGNTIPIGQAVMIDLSLIFIFTLPHTIMARPNVKLWMRKFVPFAMERSTYILISSLSLFILCIFWQPIPYAIYDLRSTSFEPLFWALYALGWFIGLFSTFLIDHFDLFGLKQAWYYKASGKKFKYKFVTPLLYKLVRHPIYLGWLMIHWFTPYLSIGQLILASAITIYILVAVEFEEKDLISVFGKAYENYKKRTPKLIPVFLKNYTGRRRDRNQDFLFF